MILDEIAAHTRLRVEKAKVARSLEQVRDAALTRTAIFRTSATGAGPESSARSAAVSALSPSANPAFEQALSVPGLSFICEVKKASPSKGLIAGEFPYLEIARDYEAAGAAAVSVLTEPEYFLGRDEYLREIATAVQIPALRKDFVIDPYQIYEAKLLGASAVLLICALLDTKTLGEYIAIADTVGLSALIETHAEDELRSALDAGARIVGINNRDLKTFQVDLSVTGRLCKLIPKDILTVSESGIRGPEDIRTLTKEQQIDAVLIGETLMRAADKKGYLKELRDAAAETKPVSKDRQ
ncbi:indole-3-glycerol phosphate synthase [Treponema primitia ZAS-2]|uniref:Indole-3-glycerol phosphate synthase n=1 Tax=Treponema primitia (strain ATCC BAA-887 / DSM 12427 / ZAS-2) TaxID=545694 RepID=F5YMB5_TREPZ|nr:indole-3-glycerol phosphate synthase TrpC [Treponema primitia]AEF85890.1 indole-3-glycerol phosphate synthase [Treponema primitia ZAS-2]